MGSSAVSDTGPIIHLSEINAVKTFKIFRSVVIPPEVKDELQKNKIVIPKHIRVKSLGDRFKDYVSVFANQFELDLGEAEAISLTLQEKANYFLTDDLDARIIAKKYGLEVHGSVGVLLRGFREKIIDKKLTIQKLHGLKNKSSLFITKGLIDRAIRSVNEFRRK